ncbi:MAG: serine/threonine-protein kinase [Candidatus Magnetobacterium sp. LHC-1]|nr:CHASE2 domain-containing protein [Nitrospirota bacterium]
MNKYPIKIPNWGVGAVISLLTMIVFLVQWYPFRYLEYVNYDFREGLRHKKSPDNIAIVAINDESIERLGHWPPQRSIMVEAINKLKTAGASVIGITIFYKDEGESEKLSAIKDLQTRLEKHTTSSTDKLATELSNILKEFSQGANMANAIQSAGNVVLPVHISFDSHLSEEKTVGTIGKLTEPLHKNSVASLPGGRFNTARVLHTPEARLSSAALALGHDNTTSDRDGILRREHLLVTYKDRLLPSFALQLVLSHKKLTIRALNPATIKGRIQLGTLSIPANNTGDMFIDYRGGYHSFPYYDFHDLLDNKVPEGVFKGKLVLIGSTVEDSASFVQTPKGDNLPYVEVVANVAENIINNNHISRPAWAFYLDTFLLLLLGAYLSLLEPRLTLRLSAIVGGTSLAVINIAGFYLFHAHGYWLQTSYPTLLLLTGYCAVAIRYYTQQTSEKKMQTFIDEEDTETNKMLGLSFQGQGQLDMAFERFCKCSPVDDSVKELLYNLGVDYEKKRMLDKALAVYEYVLSTGPYKDLNDRVKKVRISGETVIIDTSRKDSTVIINTKEESLYVNKLGRYWIIKELGRGAMGIVYKGRDPEINRDVALKTLDYAEMDLEDDEKADVEARFKREAEAAGKLFHPNIVKIFDVGTHTEKGKEIAYIAMEYLDGTDLSDYCKKDSNLHPRDVIRIITTVADALDYAHSKGVVHRDIKPANIMMLSNKEIRVTDFGVARIIESSKTETGMVMGTPSYMSPEQVTGNKVDGRSDLFSLGVLFFELLVCRKPFEGNSIAALMHSITKNPTPNIKDIDPKVPTCIANIILKMLAKDANNRYQTGKELIEAINDCKRLIKQRAAAHNVNKQK